MSFTRETWNGFISSAPHASFLQSWEWGEMQRRLHVPYWRLAVERDDKIQAAALVIKRELPWGRSWLYVPRGFVFAHELLTKSIWQELQDQVVELAKRERALFIRQDPAWPISYTQQLSLHGWAKAEREVQPRHTIVLDIQQSEEQLLAAMHHKARYNIRLAQKKGVIISFSTAQEDLQSFIELSRVVQGRSPFRYHPESYYQAMLATLAPTGMLELALARHDQETLAAHILISFAGTTTYAHGASSSKQRQLMAPHLLQWQSILRAKAAGQHTYDFFGVAPADAPADHSWSGITRFKEGFGGTRHDFVGTYDHVLDRTWYSAFTVARRMRKLLR